MDNVRTVLVLVPQLVVLGCCLSKKVARFQHEYLYIRTFPNKELKQLVNASKTNG